MTTTKIARARNRSVREPFLSCQPASNPEMASCQVCDELLCANATVVRCNGRCLGRVHPWCAKMAGVMLAANGGTDLYWFCDGCRRGLCAVPKDSGGDSGPLLDTLRKLKTRVDAMDDSLRRIERSLEGGAASKPDLPELPGEIWTGIFKEMSASQVLKVRLVCRRWKGIVDGSSALKAKFTVTFLDPVIDGDYKPEHLLPVSKVNFVNVKIRDVGPWWKSFGPGLTEIWISEYCRINSTLLMDMLKHVPNLEKLKLVGLILTMSGNLDKVADFKLNKVKELTITDTDNASLYEDVLKLCCNLKSLSLDFKHFVPLERTVACLHKTLEELHIHPTDEFLVELMKLDRLRLKKLTLAGYDILDKNIVIEFCKMQPNLEYLDIRDSLAVDELDEAGWNDYFSLFPKLECLSISLGSDCEIELKFLSSLTQLQSLTFAGRAQDYSRCLANCKLPRLRQLHLRDITFPDNSLQQWLTNVPNLRSITIDGCEFECWSDLLEALESLKQLEHLSIKISDEISETPFYYHDEFATLKSLQLTDCVMSSDMLGKLLGLCPGLREFHARSVEFNDEKLGIVCRELMQLTKLTFWRCELPKNAESYVRVNCLSLQELKISSVY